MQVKPVYSTRGANKGLTDLKLTEPLKKLNQNEQAFNWLWTLLGGRKAKRGYQYIFQSIP